MNRLRNVEVPMNDKIVVDRTVYGQGEPANLCRGSAGCVGVGDTT